MFIPVLVCWVEVWQARLVRLGKGILGALCSVMSWSGRWGLFR